MAVTIKLKPKTASSAKRRTFQATQARSKKFEAAALTILPSFSEARAVGIRALDDLASFLNLQGIKPFKARTWTARGVWRCILCLRRIGADPGLWTRRSRYSSTKTKVRARPEMQTTSIPNVGKPQ